MTTYDAIVLGLGGMGSAAARELARRGARVLGLEQFARGHDQGSSHGQTRIIRTAYYEHPAYVPLVRRAYEGWYDLEVATGRRLVTECPCLTLGPPGSELVQGVRAAAAEHRLPTEEIPIDDLAHRFPAFRPSPDWVAVVERQAGILAVDDCVRALQDDAVRLGAELREHEPVRDLRPDGEGVSVVTDSATYRAARVVLSAGPWAGRFLPDVPLTVMRQVVLWFRGREPRAFRRDRFPIFIAEVPEGHFYGLPAVDAAGVKVARHYGAPELPGPDAINRAVTEEDETPVRDFLRRHLPDADGPAARSSVCIYTLTPDRHFILDIHPHAPRIVVAAGFSGHGFKFAPVVGEVMADLAERGRTELPIDLFRIGRFGGRS